MDTKEEQAPTTRDPCPGPGWLPVPDAATWRYVGTPQHHDPRQLGGGELIRLREEVAALRGKLAAAGLADEP